MFLTIVVVAWNNEGYVEEALKSCVDGQCNDYEVIVVHNASDDMTGKVIGRMASERPDIFRVIENGKNEGVGEGRNIGLRQARGRYVAFLDGDDFFLPGSLPYLQHKLRETGYPDILLFDFQRFWPEGTLTPNFNATLLTNSDLSLPSKRVEIVPNINVAWNKVYRRGFLEENALAFSRGVYEDLAWNFACILKATTFQSVDRSCVGYRMREGSITRSTSVGHLDVLLQYRAVMQLLDSDPAAAQVYGTAIYEYARDHMRYIFFVGYRLPRAQEGRYLRDMSALLKAWRQTLPPLGPDLGLYLAALGSPRLMRLARNIMRALRRARAPIDSSDTSRRRGRASIAS